MKDRSDCNGLDLRTPESLERTWIKLRYRADQFMEQGLLPYREDWPRQKQCLVRYRFIDVTAPGVEVRPPSTTKCAPVMLPARSEHRNSTVLATSSAVP